MASMSDSIHSPKYIYIYIYIYIYVFIFWMCLLFETLIWGILHHITLMSTLKVYVLMEVEHHDLLSQFFQVNYTIATHISLSNYLYILCNHITSITSYGFVNVPLTFKQLSIPSYFSFNSSISSNNIDLLFWKSK